MISLTDFRKFFVEKYYTKEWMNRARLNYHNAEPFPHIVIDDFLPESTMDEVIKQFPVSGSVSWRTFSNDNEIKLGTKNEIQMPQIARSVCAELNSGYVVDWLEMLTDVKGLVADTRLIGGGLHQIQSGGKLGVHIDFNVEPRTGLSRQLNLLIYLNKDWDEEYGGHLELWNKDKTICIKKISPIYNRCVIFNTNGFSWHGHPHPLNTPENVTRKSLALYYYNNQAAAISAHSTIF